jgi:hypothetical protein
MLESINISLYNLLLIVFTSTWNFCIERRKLNVNCYSSLNKYTRCPIYYSIILFPACEFESKWKNIARKMARKRTEPSVESVLQHRQAALSRVETCMDCSHLQIKWHSSWDYLFALCRLRASNCENKYHCLTINCIKQFPCLSSLCRQYLGLLPVWQTWVSSWFYVFVYLYEQLFQKDRLSSILRAIYRVMDLCLIVNDTYVLCDYL